MRLLLRALMILVTAAALAGCSTHPVGRSIAAAPVGDKPGFLPAVIKVAKGEKVRLRVGNNTDKTHGFAIDEFGIKRTVDTHQTINATITATKAGTFRVYCQLHPGHQAAELVVE